MKCSECGAPISSEEKFCTSCGTPVPTPNLPAKCKCGAELAEGLKFCTSCGAPAEQPSLPAKCKCGAEFEKGLKFCTQCGEKVEDAVKKEAPPTPRPAPQPAAPEKQSAPSRPQREESTPRASGKAVPPAAAAPTAKPSAGLSGGKIVFLAIVALAVFVGMWFFSSQSKNQSPAPSAAVKSSPAQSEAPRTPPASTSAAAAKPKPSFDCAKAASVTEKLICNDAELAKLDVEVAQLYAKAKEMAADKAVFQQQSRDAWQRREEFCKDKECLEGWYNERHFVLSQQIKEGR